MKKKKKDSWSISIALKGHYVDRMLVAI